MVLAYHVIFCLYGFWLPNDPRGSWSDFVGAWELVRFGRSTKTASRQSLARARHDRELREAAKRSLKYPPVSLTGLQARAVARGFAEYVRKSGIVVHACSVLPGHVHLVIGRHTFDVELIVNQLKGHASRQLMAEGLHPLAAFAVAVQRPPTCGARGLWKVFLNNADDIVRSVDYVEGNREKEGLPPQRYAFVTPYVLNTV